MNEGRNFKITLRLILTVVFFTTVVSYSACNDTLPVVTPTSVNFVDVTSGNCTIVTFSDGKCLMIDTGGNDDESQEKVEKALKSLGVTKIDYLVLSNLLVRNIGNTAYLLNNYTVGKVFIPDVRDKSKFPFFNDVYNLIVEKNVEVKVTQRFLTEEGEAWFFTFLSPIASGRRNSSYDTLNLSDNPNTSQIYDIAPTVYIDIQGIRFLVCGDASSVEEKIILENAKIGLYDRLGVNGDKVADLTSIDFMKLARNGHADCNGIEFLNYLKPKNAILNVQSSFFVESTTVLQRLYNANDKVNLYRSDVYGCVTIKIDNGYTMEYGIDI